MNIQKFLLISLICVSGLSAMDDDADAENGEHEASDTHNASISSNTSPTINEFQEVIVVGDLVQGQSLTVLNVGSATYLTGENVIQ